MKIGFIFFRTLGTYFIYFFNKSKLVYNTNIYICRGRGAGSQSPSALENFCILNKFLENL